MFFEKYWEKILTKKFLKYIVTLTIQCGKDRKGVFINEEE
jgi:hypothetical protein